MAERKSREELLSAWWEGWRSRNYTWLGLARRSLSGDGGLHGEATLQDYWRRDPVTGEERSDEALRAAGELVEAPDGSLWHVVHLPEEIPNHGPTNKSEHWDKISELVAARIAAAKETTFTNDRLVGKDGRAQLEGAVLQRISVPSKQEQAPLHIKLSRAMLIGGANFDHCIFGPGAYFDSTCFGQFAWFDEARFTGEVIFSNVTFLGPASYARAIFQGAARFNNISALYGFSAPRSQFSGVAAFNRATIWDRATFISAKFATMAEFVRITLNDRCDFSSAEFGGGSSFGDASFLDDASFLNCSFAQNANFARASFSRNGGFDNARFQNGVVFDNATFSDGADFEGSSFAGVITFVKMSCADIVWFRAADLSKATRIRFQSAKFSGPVIFENAKWPDDGASFGAAFIDVAFPRVASFQGSDFAAFAAFDGAQFDAIVQFSSSVTETDQHLIRAHAAAMRGAKREARERAEAELDRRRQDDPDAKFSWFERQKIENIRGAKNDLLSQLQSGFRVIKQAAEKQRDRMSEQQFYRCELICRRKQSTTSPPERFFSIVYAGVADYGGSAMRPLISVLLMWLLFSAAFWAWGGSLSGVLGQQTHIDPNLPVSSDLFDAARLSGSAIFRPFAVWSERFASTPWEVQFLDHHGSGHGLMSRIVISVESVFALILFFLTALSVRRRFQIT